MSEAVLVGDLPVIAPAYYSLFPPILALALALVTRNVVASLAFGVLLGTLIYVIVTKASFLDIFADFFTVMAARLDANILFFTTILGSVIFLMARAGGTQAYGRWSEKNIHSRITAKLAAFGLGVMIFFDDYFGCIAVGTVMKPVVDAMHISREKLAYIVDSLAASLCVLVPISSWAAVILTSLTDDSGSSAGAIVQFVNTIPYDFYAINTVLLVFFICATNFDYGPMRKAEAQAAMQGEAEARAKAAVAVTIMSPFSSTSPAAAAPATLVAVLESGEAAAPHAMLQAASVAASATAATAPATTSAAPSALSTAKDAPVDPNEPPLDELATVVASEHGHILDLVVPIIFLLITTVLFIIYLGGGFGKQSKPVSDVFGDSDASLALAMASLLTLILLGVMYLPRKLMGFQDFTVGMADGMKVMVPICMILMLAWGIGGITKLLQTGEYIGNGIRSSQFPRSLLPLVIFLVSGALSFSIGTAWGTFGILLPIVNNICHSEPSRVLAACQAAVLSGSIFGDHSSPISDTTVMCSQSSGCMHIQHVLTQLPYAVTSALAAAVGFLATGLADCNPYVGLPVSVVVNAGIVSLMLFLGSRGYLKCIEGSPSKEPEPKRVSEGTVATLQVKPESGGECVVPASATDVEVVTEAASPSISEEPSLQPVLTH